MRCSPTDRPDCGSAAAAPAGVGPTRATRSPAKIAFAIAVCALALPPAAHWNQEARLVAGDAAYNDHFGAAVAISGNTIVVGAYVDETSGGDGGAGEGSAYVFTRTGTTWSQQPKLVASDGTNLDFFGLSVGISGDRIVVGARADHTTVGADAGSVYLYARSGKTWSPDGHVFASDASAGDLFGYSVGISGDTVVVGAAVDDRPAGVDAGSAYVFTRGSEFWTQQDILYPTFLSAGDLFGYSVAISGDTIVVGVPNWDAPGADDAGSIYVFTRGGDTWSQQDQTDADDRLANDKLGYSVAISGDTIVAGAPKDDSVAGIDAGSAYVFTRSGGIWTQQAHLSADDASAGDEFGGSVAISGDTIVVGALNDDTVASTFPGSAYVFTRVGESWSQRAHIFADDAGASVADVFGEAVAIDRDTAVVGASLDDIGAEIDAGSAYVFVGSFFDAFVGELPALMPARR